MTRCHEDESCSKVLNFLERLDDRIRCAQEETVTVTKPWEDVGGNRSFGYIFSEKSADWTNTFELEISTLTDLYDVFLQGQFWVKNESKVPNIIRERDVVTAESNWSFCSVVVEFELIFCHPCFDVICACTEFFEEVVYFTERGRSLMMIDDSPTHVFIYLPISIQLYTVSFIHASSYPQYHSCIQLFFCIIHLWICLSTHIIHLCIQLSSVLFMCLVILYVIHLYI